MNFEASNALNDIIWNIKGRLVRNVFLLSCVFILYSLKLFNVSGKTINPVFLLAEIIFVAIAGFVFYYNVNTLRSIILKIGKQVSITNEIIFITPLTFSLRFWDKKQPRHLEFKVTELKIRKTDNPLRFTRALDNRVFELRDKEKEAYIVFDFFDAALKEKLTEILVEVTPAELLLPGRMRHY